MARRKFGNGRMEAAENAADVPILLAGRAGALETFLAEQNAPALVGAMGVPEE